MTKVGIIREGKVPQDKRVPFTPEQCVAIQKQYGIELVVQPSPIRCYPDEEYQQKGITMQEDLSDCEILFGVKEVPTDQLLDFKTYFFFSHTIKMQPYNRGLLQTVLRKNIQLVDYECLRNERNNRLLGFGRFAGIVGAYNGLMTYGKKYGTYDLKPANLCHDFAEVQQEMKKISLPNIKIVLTGGGRVSKGAMEILDELKIRKVSIDEYLNQSFDEAVYVQLEAGDYNKKIDQGEFEVEEFYTNPSAFQGDFNKFISQTDMLIAGAYWDPKSPVLFTRDDMKADNFKIRVIADITCDIEGSIPCTVRPSTIEDPVYDYDPKRSLEKAAFSSQDTISVMAVDNLPNELPRDASVSFGEQMMEKVLPALFGEDPTRIIDRSSITKDGALTEYFSYLKDYVE